MSRDHHIRPVFSQFAKLVYACLSSSNVENIMVYPSIVSTGRRNLAAALVRAVKKDWFAVVPSPASRNIPLRRPTVALVMVVGSFIETDV